MRLISEALKKAQRMHHDPAAPAGEGGSRVGRRGQPLPAKVVALIAIGAGALVAIAAILTIMVVRRDAPAPLAAAKPTIATPVVEATPTPSSISVPSAASAPLLVAEVRPPPLPPQPSAPNLTSGPAPQALATASVSPPPTVTHKIDPRVQAFIDAIHVTGIRASGNESKVLMNDRVFRLNEIVDHTLGIRLTGIQSDSLTFVDENGVSYTKYF